MAMRIPFSQLKALVLESADWYCPTDSEPTADSGDDPILLDLVLDDIIEQKKTDKDFFIPVTVTRGRKFVGNGYITGQHEASNGGYIGSGVRPRAYYIVSHVWDPANKCTNTFNGDVGDAGVEEWSVSDDQRATDMADYLMDLLHKCSKQCGSDQRHRMYWLRKVLGISTASAEELARASMEAGL